MSETEAPDQLALEANYRAEYLRWVASLTPKDRAALQRQGLDRPKIETTAQAYLRPEVFRESTATLGLFQEDHSAEPWQHPAELLEPEEEDIDQDDLAKLGAFDPDLLRVLIRVLFLNDGKGFNPRPVIHKFVALCHCLGVPGIGDQSLESLANKLGCTRQCLSYLTTSYRDFGGLSHRSGKSDAARDALSKARSIAFTAKQRAAAIEQGISTRHRGSIRKSRKPSAESPAEAGAESV
jgi:hypothetical protein